jgi:DNA damage-inducible protein 1
MHLLDTRFAGTAVGVGSSKILGRVHLADLDVIMPDGTKNMIQCSFTVLEDNKVDLLFGLDNLKRHQCCIDLVDSRLHFHKGEFSVPFLSDGQIKRKSFAEPESPKAKEEVPKTSDAVKELIDMGFSEA